MKTEEGVWKIRPIVVELRRKIVGLRFTGLMNEGCVMIAMMDVERKGALVVETRSATMHLLV